MRYIDAEQLFAWACSVAMVSARVAAIAADIWLQFVSSSGSYLSVL